MSTSFCCTGYFTVFTDVCRWWGCHACVCTGTWTLLSHPTPLHPTPPVTDQKRAVPVSAGQQERWWGSRACVCTGTWTLLSHLTPPVTDHERAVPVSAGQQERWWGCRACVCTETWTLLSHPTPPHQSENSACVCRTARKMMRLPCLWVHKNMNVIIPPHPTPNKPTPPHPAGTVTDHERAVPVSAGQQERWWGCRACGRTRTWTLSSHPTPPHPNPPHPTPPVTDHERAVPVSAGQQERWWGCRACVCTGTWTLLSHPTPPHQSENLSCGSYLSCGGKQNQSLVAVRTFKLLSQAIGFEESYCRKWWNLTAASDGWAVWDPLIPNRISVRHRVCLESRNALQSWDFKHAVSFVLHDLAHLHTGHTVGPSQLGKNCRSLALPLRLHTRSFARCHRAFLVTPREGEGLAGDHCDSTVKSCWPLPDLYHQEWKEFEAAGGATGLEMSDHRTHWPLCVLCLHWFEHKITHDNHDIPRWIFSQAGIAAEVRYMFYLFFIWWSLVVRLCLSFIFTYI